MKQLIRSAIISILLVYSAVIYSDGNEEFIATPELNIHKVIELSDSYLIKNKYDMNSMFIQYVAFTADREWVVSYLFKSGALGGFISVYIEDKENPKITIEGGA